MMKHLDHNRLIQQAAKSFLSPIGCIQKGRSRTWIDDHGWWVGVIEFQPSSYAKGSYLNVGVCWLWYEKNYLSFDSGPYRVERFHEFKSDEEFTGIALSLAQRAKDEILILREKFATIEQTARHFQDFDNRMPWQLYHAAISAGLSGDSSLSKARFDLLTQKNIEFDWGKELLQRSSQLAKLLENLLLFRAEITKIVHATRASFKLPALTNKMFFE